MKCMLSLLTLCLFSITLQAQFKTPKIPNRIQQEKRNERANVFRNIKVNGVILKMHHDQLNQCPNAPFKKRSVAPNVNPFNGNSYPQINNRYDVKLIQKELDNIE